MNELQDVPVTCMITSATHAQIQQTTVGHRNVQESREEDYRVGQQDAEDAAVHMYRSF